MLETMKTVSQNFNICLTIAEVTSHSRDLIHVNQKFSNITGYTFQESVGKNCKFLQGPLTDPKKIDFMRASFDQQKACCVDLVNYRKDGTPFWNRLVLFPFKDDYKLYFVGLQNDITEKMNKPYSAVDLEQVKHSEICHVVRNPLAVVLGYEELIGIKDFSDQKRIEVRKKVFSAIEKIESFVLNIESQSQFGEFQD